MQTLINGIFDQIVPRHIASKEIDIIAKLRKIETTTQELLDMRNTILKYGDFNLLKEVKDLENFLDRTRK